MPISIKNPETEKLARELAGLMQTSLTDTIHEALEDRLARLKRERSGRSMSDNVREIVDRFQKLPVISNLTEDEILGYDEIGAPTR